MGEFNRDLESNPALVFIINELTDFLVERYSDNKENLDNEFLFDFDRFVKRQSFMSIDVNELYKMLLAVYSPWIFGEIQRRYTEKKMYYKKEK